MSKNYKKDDTKYEYYAFVTVTSIYNKNRTVLFSAVFAGLSCARITNSIHKQQAR